MLSKRIYSWVGLREKTKKIYQNWVQPLGIRISIYIYIYKEICEKLEEATLTSKHYQHRQRNAKQENLQLGWFEGKNQENISKLGPASRN
jgi:hypothetical protein